MKCCVLRARATSPTHPILGRRPSLLRAGYFLIFLLMDPGSLAVGPELVVGITTVTSLTAEGVQRRLLAAVLHVHVHTQCPDGGQGTTRGVTSALAGPTYVLRTGHQAHSPSLIRSSPSQPQPPLVVAWPRDLCANLDLTHPDLDQDLLLPVPYIQQPATGFLAACVCSALPLGPVKPPPRSPVHTSDCTCMCLSSSFKTHRQPNCAGDHGSHTLDCWLASLVAGSSFFRDIQRSARSPDSFTPFTLRL